MSFATRRLILVAALIFAVAAAAAGEEKVNVKYRWSVEASYPKTGMEKIDEQLQEWMEEHIALSVGEASELASADPEFSEGGWEMSTGYEVTRPSDKALSVVFETYFFPSHAAHPSGMMQAVNFSSATGEVLTLDDLFDDPDKALALFSEHAPRIVSERLTREHRDDFPDGLPDDAWFKDGLAPSRDNYSCLGLEPEGVRVYFQQYQILPYVFGMPDPLIPLSVLEPAGPSREVWPGR